MTKLKKPQKIKNKRSQINYINNRNSLINIEQLNMEIDNAFWLGLGIGSVGLLAVLYLIRNKLAKKES
jgi:hypothetical protein